MNRAQRSACRGQGTKFKVLRLFSALRLMNRLLYKFAIGWHNDDMSEKNKNVDLIVVQAHMALEDYFTEENFHKKIRFLFEKIHAIREKDANGNPVNFGLVVFPEYIGTFIGMMGFGGKIKSAKTGGEAMTRIGASLLLRVLMNMVKFRAFSTTPGLFLSRSYDMYRVYFSTFSRLAKEFSLYVVAGSILLPENKFGFVESPFAPKEGKVYNMSLTFAPDGACVNMTKKVHLVPTQEDVMKLSAGKREELKPLELPFAKAGNLICYDGFNESHTGKQERFVPLGEYYDKMGVKILTQPSANSWWWDEAWTFNEPGENLVRRDQWLCEGLYRQMNNLKNVRYGLNPLLNAQIFDYHFDGKSYIFRRGDDGKISVAREAKRSDILPESEEILLETVSAESLT